MCANASVYFLNIKIYILTQNIRKTFLTLGGIFVFEALPKNSLCAWKSFLTKST